MFCDFSSQLSGVPGNSSTLCGTLNNSWWKAIDIWHTGNVEPFLFFFLLLVSLCFENVGEGSRDEDLHICCETKG